MRVIYFFCRHCQVVIDGIVAKCFSSKPKTKEIGIELCLQFIEHEKAEEVVSALLDGVKNKNPKVSAASITGTFHFENCTI